MIERKNLNVSNERICISTPSTPHLRRHSNRRRSGELSARAIRRDTPPFWRTKTRTKREATGEIIVSVDEKYTVMVNNRPVDLPCRILGTDTIHLLEVAVKSVRTKCRSGTMRYTIPPSWIAVGAVLHYCSVIGQPPTKLNCTVLAAPFQVNGAQWVTLIDKHRGWVACEALVQPGVTDSPGSSSSRDNVL